jgi:hypothetical protein
MGYTSAEPFFATDLGSQNVKLMKGHRKPEWLKRPVFRKEAEPIIEYQLEKRTRLQLVLCDLSKDLSPQTIVTRKVYAITSRSRSPREKSS